MANANISFLTLNNTFVQQMTTINNLSNSVNELRNGAPYYKDNGGITVANGSINIQSTIGTTLTVVANALIGGLLTTNTVINSGDVSVLGQHFNVTSPNSVATFANTVITNNIFANNLTVSGNTIIQGIQQVNADRIILRANSVIPGSGYLIVNRGPGIPAGFRWNESDDNWETANITTNVYSPILTTANLSALAPTLAGFTEAVNTLGVVSANTVLLDLSKTNVFDITLANAQHSLTTITFKNAAVAGNLEPIILILRQSVVGANLVAFANIVNWSGGIQPPLSSGGFGNVDILTLSTVDGGVTYLGSSAGGGGATSNAVNAAANTVEVISNYGAVLYNKHLNFVNTSSMNVSVSSNGANADIFFQTGANLVSNTVNAFANQSNFIMNGAPVNNNPTLVLVTRNGLLLSPGQYSVNGTILTLSTPALGGEVVETRVIQMLGGPQGSGGSGNGGGTGNGSVLLIHTGYGLTGGDITTSGTISANIASVSVPGVTLLVDSVSTPDRGNAATANAVYTAYVLASVANGVAQSAFAQANAAFAQANLAYTKANAAPNIISGNTSNIAVTTNGSNVTIDLRIQDTFGAPGANGANGSPGAPGPAGLTGATGPSGLTGAAGNTGSPGATGSPGSPGSVGATGLTGPKGNTGNTGLTGNTGAAGTPGSIGPTGPAGAAGTPGSIGPTGPAGAPGSSGNAIALGIYANGTLTLANANLNFLNTSTINVSSVANGTTQANISFSVNVAAINGNSSAAYSQANAAYNQANLAYAQANSVVANSATGAFNQANNAYSAANSALALAADAYTLANSGSGANVVSVFANGTLSVANSNLNFNNTSTLNVAVTSGAGFANIAFSVNVAAFGNSSPAAAYAQANLAYTEANAAYGQANSAYAQANLAYTKANSITETIGMAAYTQANLAYAEANAAYALAAIGGNGGSGIIISDSYVAIANQRVFNLTANATDANTLVVSIGGLVKIPNIDYGISGNTILTMASNTALNANVEVRILQGLGGTGGTGNGTAAYAQANLAYTAANAALALATTGNATGSAAYAEANLAYGQANISYAQSNVAYGQANLAYGQANVAYGQANLAYSAANAAFVLASNANGTIAYTQANAAYNIANAAIALAANAYLLANSVSHSNLAGPPGPTGATGPTGAPGAAGPSGTAGSPGSAGATGPAGPSNTINATNDTTIAVFPVGVGVIGSASTAYANPNFVLAANGMFQAVDFASTSDATLKTVTGNISNALGKLLTINGVEYYWNDLAKIRGIGDDTLQVGVLAQEVQVVLPESVTKTSFGTLSVSYDKLVPLLIEAIKELSDKVAKLEAK